MPAYVYFCGVIVQWNKGWFWFPFRFLFLTIGRNCFASAWRVRVNLPYLTLCVVQSFCCTCAHWNVDAEAICASTEFSCYGNLLFKACIYLQLLRDQVKGVRGQSQQPAGIRQNINVPVTLNWWYVMNTAKWENMRAAERVSPPHSDSELHLRVIIFSHSPFTTCGRSASVWLILVKLRHVLLKMTLFERKRVLKAAELQRNISSPQGHLIF